MKNSPLKMVIDEEKEISALQEEFNMLFPYLKIRLLTRETQQIVIKILRQNRTLKSSRILYSKGKVTITPGMTVADLDSEFQKIYGIGVQVFRKSGKAWLEITFTEGWTLEEQNRQGEELSK